MSHRRQTQLLLWGYFWLLIFEGALRKWVAPGLSLPLLVVRDPIALLALVMGMRYINDHSRAWIHWMWVIGVVAFFLAMVTGHRDLPTAIFGARIWLVHFPLIFVFASVFARDDVWSFVHCTALTAIPMALLITLQYSLPQSHFLNIAPGGEAGGGFSGAMGKFRPPGTFSFTTGLVDFYAFAAAGVIAWLLGGPRPIPKWLWASVGALLVALPVSISRGLLFKYAITGLAAFASGILGGRQIKGFLYAVIIVGMAAAAVSQIPVVRDAVVVFETRWDRATANEGGEDGVTGVLGQRVGGSTLRSVRGAFDFPLLGHGIGMGTHFGAVRLTGIRRAAIAEGVWGATIGELGPILGLTAMGFRVVLMGWMGWIAWHHACRANPLPLLLASFVLPLVFMGQTSQPTGLGFLVVGAGLALAACNPTRAELLMRSRRLRHTDHPIPQAPEAPPTAEATNLTDAQHHPHS